MAQTRAGDPWIELARKVVKSRLVGFPHLTEVKVSPIIGNDSYSVVTAIYENGKMISFDLPTADIMKNSFFKDRLRYFDSHGTLNGY